MEGDGPVGSAPRPSLAEHILHSVAVTVRRNHFWQTVRVCELAVLILVHLGVKKGTPAADHDGVGEGGVWREERVWMRKDNSEGMLERKDAHEQTFRALVPGEGVSVEDDAGARP